MAVPTQANLCLTVGHTGLYMLTACGHCQGGVKLCSAKLGLAHSSHFAGHWARPHTPSESNGVL